jgi:hypothetical protein
MTFQFQLLISQPIIIYLSIWEIINTIIIEGLEDVPIFVTPFTMIYEDFWPFKSKKNQYCLFIYLDFYLVFHF